MEEVTFYRFLSEIKYFLGGLIKNPISAKPSDYLKNLGFYKSRIIKALMNRGVLERNENILFPDKTGHEYPEYNVKYNVVRKNFERNIHRIYSKYFEKNEPTMINECDCGACCDCGASEINGATNSQSSGQYVGKFGEIQRRTIYGTSKKKNKNEIKPEDVLGKDLNENKTTKTPKKVRFTEKQLKYILETTTATAGDYQYAAPFPADKETADRTPGFSCKTV